MKRRWIFFHRGGEVMGSVEVESKREAFEVGIRKFKASTPKVLETCSPMDAYEAGRLDEIQEPSSEEWRARALKLLRPADELITEKSL